MHNRDSESVSKFCYSIMIKRFPGLQMRLLTLAAYLLTGYLFIPLVATSFFLSLIVFTIIFTVTVWLIQISPDNDKVHKTKNRNTPERAFTYLVTLVHLIRFHWLITRVYRVPLPANRQILCGHCTPNHLQNWSRTSSIYNTSVDIHPNSHRTQVRQVQHTTLP